MPERIAAAAVRRSVAEAKRRFLASFEEGLERAHRAREEAEEESAPTTGAIRPPR